MSELRYKIQLTSNPDLAGPYYNVEYTTGSVYNTVPSGSPVYLPNSESFDIVSIPSGSFTYLGFKLTVSGSDFCSNSVEYTVTGSAPVPTPTPTPSVTITPTPSSVAPSPTPTPTPSATLPPAPINASWYFVTDTSGGCATAVFNVTKNGSSVVNIGGSTSDNGLINVAVGDVLVITMTAGTAGAACSNPKVSYSSNQSDYYSAVGAYPAVAQITITVTSADISSGSIILGGALGNGVIPS